MIGIDDLPVIRRYLFCYFNNTWGFELDLGILLLFCWIDGFVSEPTLMVIEKTKFVA